MYYWSVQAVDTAFAGGSFAIEASFAIPSCYLPLILKQVSQPPCTPLYADNFSNPVSGWPVGEDAKALVQYDNE